TTLAIQSTGSSVEMEDCHISGEIGLACDTECMIKRSFFNCTQQDINVSAGTTTILDSTLTGLCEDDECLLLFGSAEVVLSGVTIVADRPVNMPTGGVLSMNNSIVHGGSLVVGDVSGTFIDGGYNIVASITGASLDTSILPVGTDPMLGPLGD